jgi:malate synthase
VKTAKPAKRMIGSTRIAARHVPSRPPSPQRQTARTRATQRKPSRTPARRGATPVLKGVRIHAPPNSGPMSGRYSEILTTEALAFLASLHRTFDKTRHDLLAERAARQRRFDAGELPDFLQETKDIRNDAAWQVAPVPRDLTDRRVEITGPVDRKMVVNALNSGATDYMADFEDANSPSWANNIEGQLNLKDRWAGTIAFTDPASGKHYDIGAKPAVLIVRPRGWHLDERHLTVDGKPISGALFDFGLYLFHNATASLAAGSGPYFYLPKIESHKEARLWNEVFLFAQEKLGMPRGTIKTTVLIETLPAAFEMEEILYELRQHIAGMNAGRWDYIFSFIKTFAKSTDPRFIFPDRGQVVMGKDFLGAYARLLVETCHKRGAFAMGGMAAQIPIKNDPDANAAAFAKVKADKEREVHEGYDGTWVAHPDLVPVATEVFDRLMPQPNQRDRIPPANVARDDLLKVHEGTRTETGFRLNIRVGVQYIEAWLRGRGAAPIYHLMEDAATAEISRAQLWQWIKAGVALDGGGAAPRTATADFFLTALAEEMDVVKEEVGAAAYADGRFPEAIDLFRDLTLADAFAPFLTIPAYKLID